MLLSFWGCLVLAQARHAKSWAPLARQKIGARFGRRRFHQLFGVKEKDGSWGELAANFLEPIQTATRGLVDDRFFCRAADECKPNSPFHFILVSCSSVCNLLNNYDLSIPEFASVMS